MRRAPARRALAVLVVVLALLALLAAILGLSWLLSRSESGPQTAEDFRRQEHYLRDHALEAERIEHTAPIAEN